MLRFIIASIYVGLALILSLPVWLVLQVVGLFSDQAKEKATLAIARPALRVIVFIAGTDVTFIGLENANYKEPALYVSNHRSFFDVIIPATKQREPLCFIAKKEFGRIPILNLWMKNLHCLFLDRKDLKQGLKVVLSAIHYLKDGRSVYICPEGTRNRTDELLLPFKEGSLKIAAKSGCPIIPMAITGSDEVFEKQFPKLRKAKVVVRYGKPFYASDLDKEDQKFLGAYTANIIREMLLENQKLISDGTRSR